jgi:hypothetical protein
LFIFNPTGTLVNFFPQVPFYSQYL